MKRRKKKNFRKRLATGNGGGKRKKGKKKTRRPSVVFAFRTQYTDKYYIRTLMGKFLFNNLCSFEKYVFQMEQSLSSVVEGISAQWTTSACVHTTATQQQ